MRLGVMSFNTEYTIRADELAIEAEARGFESVWFPEHTHIPAGRKTPYPAGGDLPKEYIHMSDPFISCGVAAAVTKDLIVGTGVSLVPQHEPLAMAKRVATLDRLTNGRFEYGIGAGWNEDEMENHGVNYKQRWAVTREKVLAMKEVWSNDEAEFHGEHVDFDPLWSWPKPTQEGGPRIWMGANSKWVYDRVAEYCDGWMPIGGLGSGGAERMQEALEAKGRKLEDLDMALFAAPADYDQLRFRIDQGFEHLVFSLPPAGEDKILPLLDDLAALADRARGG